MHDIRSIRENPQDFDAGLARRGLDPLAQALIALDEARRAATTEVQVAQSRRNEASKLIGAAMAKGDRDGAEAIKAEVAALKEQMPALEARAEELAGKLKELLEVIPNLPGADVPDGGGEEDNVEVSRWGTLRDFDFQPREHADIAPALGMDFETGTRLSGARFTFLRGGMARLHRALGQFMLDVQTGEHGYAECNPPVLVGDDAMYGTDKLPKFAEDSFETHVSMQEMIDKLASDGIEQFKQDAAKELSFNSAGFNAQLYQTLRESMVGQAKAKFKSRGSTRRWLIPTSEVSLTASVMGELLDEAALPMRLTALTLCFRSEAGAAGRDTRGFIRQHQFEKCELVSIVRPEESEAEHQRMVRAAETILERLALPYRKLLLCTGDMGFGARKTYDLEVWLPGQGAYREISSCSNTGDFQARRMNTRYRVAGEKKTEFVHTLNGSGLAVGRTLVAVIENYQNADGSVTVPDALLPYMGGITRLEPLA
ncbi:serine--tRNA ligase [Erythrobacter neustonensis]|uniref:Serine--tRNA ligase n=1 Tax=Erythrobacter neustonensis TaxID=1112 RepID=A0A192D1B2_9SPHN|nr:serine--tRNA ligase [Erythrobacter neustonensis]ANK11915.1 serine--tRNA ligase [Erythrobacter neustonensis]